MTFYINKLPASGCCNLSTPVNNNTTAIPSLYLTSNASSSAIIECIKLAHGRRDIKWFCWRETDEEKLKKITLPTPESEQTLLSMI